MSVRPMNSNATKEEKQLNSTNLFEESKGDYGRITRPIFIILTFAGLKPHKNVSLSSEVKPPSKLRGIFQSFSILGFIMTCILLILGLNATRVGLRISIYFIKKYGLFHGTSVTAMQNFLLVQIGMLFVLCTLILAPKFIKLRTCLDSISLSTKALEGYKKLMIFVLIFIVFLAVSFVSVMVYTVIIDMYRYGIQYSPSWFSVLNLFCSYHFSLLCFIGPLSWGLSVSFFLCMAFKANSTAFDKAILQQDQSSLRQVFLDYIKLSEVVEHADSVFAFTVMLSVFSYLFLICTALLNLASYANYIPLAVMFSFVLTSTLLGISISSIRLNEQAHSIQGPLRHCIPANFETKVLVDQFYRKATDPSWGITIGKMVPLDRAAILTIGGGMLGFIALWSQFAADSQGDCTYGASNNTSSHLNMTEYVLRF